MATRARVPAMPTVAELVKLYGISARSQLSQNFILDSNVTDKIARASKCLAGGNVIEVGPGPGPLTRSILKAGPRKLVAIEKDRRFLPSLQLLADSSDGVLSIVHGDVLKFDYGQLDIPCVPWEDDPTFAIVGNLPFNIATPLLIQWLSMIAARTGPFANGRGELVLTFQKEVAERIVAAPGTPQRSRVSAIAQMYCDARLACRLPSKVFVPAPKVDAAAVILVPKRIISPELADFTSTETVMRGLFSFRRKTLRNSASALFPDAAVADAFLARASLNPSQRAQSLDNDSLMRAVAAYIAMKKTCGPGEWEMSPPNADKVADKVAT
eukprot:Opistho-2@48484